MFKRLGFFRELVVCNVQLRVISEQLVEALPDEVCVARGAPSHLPAFVYKRRAAFLFCSLSVNVIECIVPISS
jgi:hypothetical protein